MKNSTHELSLMIVDDDEGILVAAEFLLSKYFKQVYAISSPSEIVSMVKKHHIDIFLLDMNFSLGRNTGQEGLFWLKNIRSLCPHSKIVLMTAYADIRIAVDAIKLGACDFVTKPWCNDELVLVLQNAVKYEEKDSGLSAGQSSSVSIKTENEVVCESAQMAELILMIDKVAKTDTNVLLTGESGVGKEVIAQRLHEKSHRRSGPFIAVDMGSLPETLIESELFGHKAGAFSGAVNSRKGRFLAADGGTLFLDEIGNITLPVQVKLLRALELSMVTPLGSDQTHKVDVRIVAATNMPLEQLVSEGKFRMDLFYRLQTIQVRVPPLRERRADIKPLISNFLQMFARKYKAPNKEISDDVLAMLCNYDWPGNIRQLRHAVERAVIMSGEQPFKYRDFVQGETIEQTQVARPQSPCLNLELNEKNCIITALKLHEENYSKASKDLGITRTSLYRRIKKFEL